MFTFNPITGLHALANLGADMKTATIAPQHVLTHELNYECNFLLKCLEFPLYRWPHIQVRLGGIQISGGGGGSGGELGIQNPMVI